MRKITWEVQFLTAPSVIRHCKKCGQKSEFHSSGLFRINAQRKSLDIWLIYKCIHCDSTWNHTIFSRINPQSLPLTQLERFHANDKDLAFQYAMDVDLLHSDGVATELPTYQIVGEDWNKLESVQLCITSPYPSQIKVSKVLREKCGLSSKSLEQMLKNGQIRCSAGLDVKKAKLGKEIHLILDIEKGGNTDA